MSNGALSFDLIMHRSHDIRRLSSKPTANSQSSTQKSVKMPGFQGGWAKADEKGLLDLMVSMYKGLISARKRAGLSVEDVKKSPEEVEAAARPAPHRPATLNHIKEEMPALSALYDRLQAVVGFEQGPDNARDVELLLRDAIEELDPDNTIILMEKTDQVRFTCPVFIRYDHLR